MVPYLQFYFNPKSGSIKLKQTPQLIAESALFQSQKWFD